MGSQTEHTLAQQLIAQAEKFRSEADDATQQTMQKAAKDLAESGIVDNSLEAGDEAPDFELPNANGERLRLSTVLQEGPAILSFYRGGWCPYCNLELRAFQQHLPKIKAKGGQLLAISPQSPDHSLTTAQKHELEFEVLSDVGNVVARRYGLVFTLPIELREIYAKAGIDLVEANAEDSFELPLPATYVIDHSGKVTFAFVNTDYKRRAEPADVIAALD